MFYVLFTYSKGRKERDFRGFRSEDELIEFLHEDYEKIDIVQIIGVEKTYRLGLIETEELAKSVLVSQDLKVELSGQGDPLPPIEEKTAMEKIGDDIEEEIKEETAEQKIIRKNKEALKRADSAMEAAKKDLEKKGKFIPKPDEKEPEKRPYKVEEDRKKDWAFCPECKKNKMAPWNKSDRCSECQQYKKIPKKR